MASDENETLLGIVLDADTDPVEVYADEWNGVVILRWDHGTDMVFGRTGRDKLRELLDRAAMPDPPDRPSRPPPAGAGPYPIGPTMKVDLGPWQRMERDALADTVAAATGAPGLRIYQVDVADGHLTVMAGAERGPSGPRWHLSISHRTNDDQPRPGRYPTWDEISDARYRFMPGDITVAQILPPLDEYVNVATTTFHLWEIEGDGA